VLIGGGNTVEKDIRVGFADHLTGKLV
jgi:hypothetical protein